MKTSVFGTLKDGKKVILYTLENANGIEASFTDIGGSLVSLKVPDKNGVKRDVILGYQDVQGYLDNPLEFGASVGRNANRIKGSVFTINGQTYHIAKNEGENNLHSGPDMWFTKRMHAVMEIDDEYGEMITFSMISPDGDQGMPGECSVEITYTLTDDNELYCEYTGSSDKDTIFNMTNHNYFNLNGDDSGDVLKHRLQIFADTWTPTDPELIPTGEIASVEGTPLDFRTEKAIGRDMDQDYLPFVYGKGGYDQNYIINGGVVTEDANPAAKVTGDLSGICMEVFTDRPCLQFYTSNWGDETHIGRNGVTYRKHQALCLEAQYAPDAVHHDNFASPVLKAGEESTAVTVFRFSIDKH